MYFQFWFYPPRVREILTSCMADNQAEGSIADSLIANNKNQEWPMSWQNSCYTWWYKKYLFVSICLLCINGKIDICLEQLQTVSNLTFCIIDDEGEVSQEK